jgi:hypothetical protein
MKSTFFRDFWEPIAVWSKALFTDLPPTYGDTVPPELRIFESQADEAQHHPRQEGALPRPHHARSKPRKVGSGPKPQAA